VINGLKTHTLPCTDWYQLYYENGVLVDMVYLDSTGDCSDAPPISPGGGGGNGGAPGDGTGGGGGTIGPDDPCATIHSVSPTQTVNSTKGVNTFNPEPPVSSDPGDGGFPPPEPPTYPCVVVTVETPVMDIIDSLSLKYPCAKALIAALPNLNSDLARLIYQAFDSKDGSNITFHDGSPSYFTGTNSTLDGFTNNYNIFINPSVLTNSSNEYRLVTMYHEAIHAFLDLEHKNLSASDFAAKYPAIKVVPRPNSTSVAGADPNDYYIDEGAYMTQVDPKHRTMADYFTDELKNAILAYNPNFPVDRATALARGGIFVNDTSNKYYNDSERDVTKGNSVGTKCTP